MAENSTPPKERINITYKSKTNNQTPEIELPLKLMVMADFTGGNKVALEERELISINKHNFNQVMQKMQIESHFSVKNTLQKNNQNDKDNLQNTDELSIDLKIESMQDFTPDSIANQVPELNKLLKLREALIALKGPMGNIPDFRKAVLEALKNKDVKEKLLLEIQDSKKENDG